MGGKLEAETAGLAGEVVGQAWEDREAATEMTGKMIAAGEAGEEGEAAEQLFPRFQGSPSQPAEAGNLVALVVEGAEECWSMENPRGRTSTVKKVSVEEAGEEGEEAFKL